MDRTPEAENYINSAKYMNSFWLIEDYIFANDLRFFDRAFQKNVKSLFLKSEKKRKIRILEHCMHLSVGLFFSRNFYTIKTQTKKSERFSLLVITAIIRSLSVIQYRNHS